MRLTLDEITSAVCSRLVVDPEHVLGQRRTKRLALARHVAQFIAREHGGFTLKEIGQHFGRDHTTVLYGVVKIEDECQHFSETWALVVELLQGFRARVAS